MKTSTYLRLRRLRGKERPHPQAVLFVNLMGASAKPAKSKAILQEARTVARRGVFADTILGCEAADIRCNRILNGFWDVFQDCTSEDRAGSMAAVHKSEGRLKRPRLKLGTLPYLNGRRADRMLTRWFIKTKIHYDAGTPHSWKLRARIGHLPPKRNWFLWPLMMARFTAGRGLLAADFNKLPRAIKPLVGTRRVRMVGVLGFAVPRHIPVSDPIPVDVGGDHLAVLVILWPEEGQ